MVKYFHSIEHQSGYDYSASMGSLNIYYVKSNKLSACELVSEKL